MRRRGECRHAGRRRQARAHRAAGGKRDDGMHARRYRRPAGLADADRYPHPSRQGPHGRAQSQYRRHVPQRAPCGRRRPAELDRGGSASAHGFRSALRLCARRLGDPHAYRHLSRYGGAKLAGAARDARANGAARSICRRCRCARSACWRTSSATGWLRPLRNRAACSAASRAPPSAITARRSATSMRCSTGCSGLRRGTISTSICTSTKPTIRRRRRCRSSPARRCGTATRAAWSAAIAAVWRKQPATEIDRTLDLLAEAEIAIVTLPTVNMYLAGPHRGPHAALARRHRRPRDVAPRHPRRRRRRQLPRQLLRLRRPRRGRHLPPGGSHPAPRSSARRRAGPGRRGACGDRPNSRHTAGSHAGAPARLDRLQRAHDQRNRQPAAIGPRR